MKLAEAFVEFNADLTKLKTGFSEAENITEKSLKRIGDKMQAVGKKMAIIGAAATASFGVAVKQSADFEAMLKRVELQSGATANEMESIKAEALSSDFVKLGKSGTDVANTYNRLASEGYEVIEMKKMLKPITEASIVLGTEEAETTKLMLNLMQQYNLEATDMGHISDVLAGALANTSFQGGELVEVMKYAGVAASELGWSLEGTIPIVDSVIKVTGEASMAGTQFRMMVNMLLDPTAKMEEEFKKVGISLNEVSEAIKSPIDLIALLNKAHENGANFAAMFGARAGSAAAVIARQEIPAIEELTEKVNENGKAHEMASGIMDTTSGKFQSFGAAMKNTATTIGDVLLPVMSQLADWASNLATKFKEWADENKTLFDILVKVGAFLAAFAAVGGPILMAAGALMKMTTVVKGLVTVLVGAGGLNAAFLLLTANVYIWLEVIKEVNTILNSTHTSAQDVANALQIQADAQQKLADKLGISVEELKKFQAAGASVSEMMGKELPENIKKTTDSTKEFTKEFVDSFEKSVPNALKRAEEVIAEYNQTLSEHEKQVMAINEKYNALIKSAENLYEDEQELASAINTLEEARQAELALLDRALEAYQKEMEAKKKLADLTKSLNDKIFEFTHSEYDVKLRDINREYDTLIEQAKKVYTEKGKLNEAIKVINEERQKEIDGLQTLDEENKQVTESTSELKDKTQELAETTKEAAEAVKETAEAGKSAWEGLTIQITKATAELSNFTKEGLASAIAQIKMKYMPLISSLIDTMNNSMGYARKMAEYQLNEATSTMNRLIQEAINGLKYYEDALAMVSTGSPIGSSSFGSYQTGTDYVPKTGLYMLHKGEAVIPANQNTTNNNNTFSPNITINASGNSNAQDIAYEVKKVLEDSARQFKRTGYELIPGMG